MPKSAKITDKVFARVEPDLAEGINAIMEKHHMEPAVLLRGLLKSAVAFYRQHGFFSFPVRIEPEAFQGKWIAAEGGQGKYAGPSAPDVLSATLADEGRRAVRRKQRGSSKPSQHK